MCSELIAHSILSCDSKSKIAEKLFWQRFMQEMKDIEESGE